MANLSVTVKFPRLTGEMYVESQWQEQPLISKLLEKLRRATETLLGPKCCEPVDKRRGSQSREDREMELRTIFKKPHQVSEKLDMSERRVLAEEYKRKAVTAELEPGGAKVKKGVRLTVMLSPYENM